jgi:hypothetical protein
MKKERWLIKLTDEQLHCIMRGMEYYHRMMCGEIDNVDIICEHQISHTFKQMLKEMMFPELPARGSYSWNGTDESPFGDEMARSYQIYREMLHQVTIRNGDKDVYSSPTLSSGKVESLDIEQIK